MDTKREHIFEQMPDPPHIQPSADMLAQPLASISAEGQPSASLPPYYIREGDDSDGADDEESSPFATPFQLSSALPVIEMDQGTGSGVPLHPPTGGKRATPRRRLAPLTITLAIIVVVVVLGLLWLTVFAQPTPPLSTTPGVPSPVLQAPTPTTKVKTVVPITQPTPVPTVNSSSSTPGSPQNGTWVPQQLPLGWTNAGLTVADGIFAERTAWTFTDREEGLDFRNSGNQGQHAGTFTAATFILSPGGKNRFFQNDVRVSDNTLFDHVLTAKLIQAAVNAVPSLVNFQVLGQNEFAWVDVSFQLYQSQINPNDPQQTRVEGLQMDLATNQPRIHHMSVLLVRITPGTQGSAAPMGGSGWLVSNYGLDQVNNTPVAIVQPV